MLKALDESFSSRTAIPTRNLHKLDHAHAETIFIFETQCKLSRRQALPVQALDTCHRRNQEPRATVQRPQTWPRMWQMAPRAAHRGRRGRPSPAIIDHNQLGATGRLSHSGKWRHGSVRACCCLGGGGRQQHQQIKGTHTCAAARARTATCSSATSKVKQLLAAQPECRVPGRHSSRAKM